MTLAFANNWITQLDAALGASDDTLPIPSYAADALDFSDDREYILTLASDSDLGAPREIVRVAAGLVMQRGQEGTEPLSWPAGSTVYCGVTAGGLQELGASSGTPPAVVNDDVPDRPPLHPGEVWVARYHTYIATGTESLYDWQRMSGVPRTQGYGAHTAGPTTDSVHPLVERYYLSSSTPLDVVVAFIVDLELSPADLPAAYDCSRELIMQLAPQGLSSVRAELVIPPADNQYLGVAAELADAFVYNSETRRLSIEVTEPTALHLSVYASEYEGQLYYELAIFRADYEEDPWVDLVDIPTGEEPEDPEEPGAT